MVSVREFVDRSDRRRTFAGLCVGELHERSGRIVVHGPVRGELDDESAEPVRESGERGVPVADDEVRSVPRSDGTCGAAGGETGFGEDDAAREFEFDGILFGAERGGGRRVRGVRAEWWEFHGEPVGDDANAECGMAESSDGCVYEWRDSGGRIKREN